MRKQFFVAMYVVSAFTSLGWLASPAAAADQAASPLPGQYWQIECPAKKSLCDCLECCSTYLMKKPAATLCAAECGATVQIGGGTLTGVGLVGLIGYPTQPVPAVIQSCVYCVKQPSVEACQTCCKPEKDGAIAKDCCVSCCTEYTTPDKALECSTACSFNKVGNPIGK